MSDQPIYFWGYSGHKLPDLLRLQAEKGALIVDARHKPYSRFRPEWNQRALADCFGVHYQHVPALGNRNYRSDALPIDIVDLEAGITAILAAARPVIVLCTCKAPAGCHTTVLRDALAHRGHPVVELRVDPGSTAKDAQITLF